MSKEDWKEVIAKVVIGFCYIVIILAILAHFAMILWRGK